jgi:hypothetical protein
MRQPIIPFQPVDNIIINNNISTIQQEAVEERTCEGIGRNTALPVVKSVEDVNLLI